MTTFFADTSALGKRYVSEVGSSWVLSWILPSAGHIIVVSDLAQIETFSVFARLQREGLFSPADVAILQNQALLHLEKEYLTVALEAPVLAQARQLVDRYPLRTLDAIQLACALRATALLGETITFVCADNRLLTAAAAEGFVTDNPLLHP